MPKWQIYNLIVKMELPADFHSAILKKTCCRHLAPTITPSILMDKLCAFVKTAFNVKRLSLLRSWLSSVAVCIIQSMSWPDRSVRFHCVCGARTSFKNTGIFHATYSGSNSSVLGASHGCPSFAHAAKIAKIVPVISADNSQNGAEAPPAQHSAARRTSATTPVVISNVSGGTSK